MKIYILFRIAEIRQAAGNQRCNCSGERNIDTTQTFNTPKPPKVVPLRHLWFMELERQNWFLLWWPQLSSAQRSQTKLAATTEVPHPPLIRRTGKKNGADRRKAQQVALWGLAGRRSTSQIRPAPVRFQPVRRFI